MEAVRLGQVVTQPADLRTAMGTRLDTHDIALAGQEARKLAEDMAVLVRRSGVPISHLDEVFECLCALLQQDAKRAQALLWLEILDKADRD